MATCPGLEPENPLSVVYDANHCTSPPQYEWYLTQLIYIQHKADLTNPLLFDKSIFNLRDFGGYFSHLPVFSFLKILLANSEDKISGPEVIKLLSCSHFH